MLPVSPRQSVGVFRVVVVLVVGVVFSTLQTHTRSSLRLSLGFLNVNANGEKEFVGLVMKHHPLPLMRSLEVELSAGQTTACIVLVEEDDWSRVVARQEFSSLDETSNNNNLRITLSIHADGSCSVDAME